MFGVIKESVVEEVKIEKPRKKDCVKKVVKESKKAIEKKTVVSKTIKSYLPLL